MEHLAHKPKTAEVRLVEEIKDLVEELVRQFVNARTHVVERIGTMKQKQDCGPKTCRERAMLVESHTGMGKSLRRLSTGSMAQNRRCAPRYALVLSHFTFLLTMPWSTLRIAHPFAHAVSHAHTSCTLALKLAHLSEVRIP